MKRLDARTYLKETFRSVTDAAHSVWFEAGTPAHRVVEYLEEYARTQNITLTNTLEAANHLLAKLHSPWVCQEEWVRYNRNAGDPMHLRESVIEPFGYAEILDHRGTVYGVRFPNQTCLVATPYDEPDLYEGEDARTMWQKYARHIEVLERIGGEIIPYAWPGGYPMIYWHCAEDHSLFPLCAKCTEEDELLWGTLWEVESGDLYDHDLPCDQCGQQLAAYYEEEEEDS